MINIKIILNKIWLYKILMKMNKSKELKYATKNHELKGS